MVTLTITRYRKGVLQVPQLNTDIIDSIGASLMLRTAGANRMILSSSYDAIYRHLAIMAGYGIVDNAVNTIIGIDDAGHIDELARIDTPVTNPAGSQEVTLTPMELISPSQSGTLDEDEGFWYAPATDSLYLYLNTIFHYLMLRGATRIEQIIVFINTSAVNDYVTAITFNSYNSASGAQDVNIVDTDDVGNGSTGDEYGVITVNTTIETNRWYRLKIDAVVGASFVTVRAIKITYSLT